MVTNSSYHSGSNDQGSLSALPKRKAGSKFTSGHLLMILSGLATFLLIITLLGSQGNKITVFVANDDIFAGQQITAGDFTAEEIPSSDLDGKYFSPDDFKNGKVYASKTISKGEPLLKSAQAPKSETQSVVLQSIPISKKFAVNGILAKGDTIDVIEVDEDGCAYKAMSGLSVVTVSGDSGSGALGGGDSTYTITVALESDTEILKLSRVIANGNFQIVRTTGTQASGDPDASECGGSSLSE